MPLDWKENPLLVFVIFTAVDQRYLEAFVFVGNIGTLQAAAGVSLQELKSICVVDEILCSFRRASHHLGELIVVLIFV